MVNILVRTQNMTQKWNLLFFLLLSLAYDQIKKIKTIGDHGKWLGLREPGDVPSGETTHLLKSQSS